MNNSYIGCFALFLSIVMATYGIQGCPKEQRDSYLAMAGAIATAGLGLVGTGRSE
jgi:hypothetical protein